MEKGKGHRNITAKPKRRTEGTKDERRGPLKERDKRKTRNKRTKKGGIKRKTKE